MRDYNPDTRLIVVLRDPLERAFSQWRMQRERAARRQLVRVGRTHDQRAGAAHLLVDHADRVVGGIVGAEGIGADQFGQRLGEVGLGAAHRPHLVQYDRHARLRELPGRLAAREAAADDVYGLGA